MAVRYARAKIIMTLLYACHATVWPWLSLIIREKGFDNMQVGVTHAVIPVVSLVGAPLFSMIADVTHKHKIILMTITLMMSIAIYWYLKSVSYMMGLFAISVYAFFRAPQDSMIDATVIIQLEVKEDYGSQRLWGSISHGVVTLLVGVCGVTVMTNVLYFHFALVILLAVLIPKLYVEVPKREAQRNPITLASLRAVLNGKLFVFYFVVFVFGFAYRCLHTFQSVHLKDKLNASVLMLSVSNFTKAISEVPFFYLSKRLLIYFGPCPILILSSIVFAVQCFVYAEVTNPWTVLGVDLFNGLCYGLLWATCVYIVAMSVPSSMQSTAQTMTCMCFHFLSAILANLFGGFVAEHAGGTKSLFVIVSFIFFGNAVSIFILQRVTQFAAITAKPRSSVEDGMLTDIGENFWDPDFQSDPFVHDVGNTRVKLKQEQNLDMDDFEEMATIPAHEES